MKIVVCYPIINGYMAACWRALAGRGGIDLFVLGHQPTHTDLVEFNSNVMAGVSSRLLQGSERVDPRLVAKLVEAERPDLLIISGWSEPAYRPLYFNPRLGRVPKVLVMDNQFRGTLRQLVGRTFLQLLLRRVSCVWVAGERTWQYARFLRVPEWRIRRGALGVDVETLSACVSRRAPEWPRRFLFVGRYHPRKGLDVLARAYSEYRRTVREPWPLVLAGKGPESAHFREVDGVTDLGFRSPGQMIEVWSAAGALVQPSRYDAWPLTIAEGAAAALPIIATEECGSTVEIVRNLYNGLVVPTCHPTGLTNALRWMHDHHASLRKMGERSAQLAAPFSAEAWADRAIEIAATFRPQGAEG